MLVTRQWLLCVAAGAALAFTGAGVSAQTATDPEGLYGHEPTRLEKSNKMWNQNDICGKESFQKFSDYTADGALKRDAYMRDCLRKHHLPPRNDVAQPLPRSQ